MRGRLAPSVQTLHASPTSGRTAGIERWVPREPLQRSRQSAEESGKPRWAMPLRSAAAGAASSRFLAGRDEPLLAYSARAARPKGPRMAPRAKTLAQRGPLATVDRHSPGRDPAPYTYAPPPLAVERSLQYLQYLGSALFVVLYVWSTYDHPPLGSWRAGLELTLCFLFAVEYFYRLLVHHSSWASRLRMVGSLWNICDVLAFAPPLLEVLLPAAGFLHNVDFRALKILRSTRVLRIGLLSSELSALHLSSTRGSWLAAGSTFRLLQLGASLLILVFTTSAVIQILEKLPFHQAIYLVMTTLTTVGFGDVVAHTTAGRAAILVLICVGAVLIPVQAAALLSELHARRLVRGRVPSSGTTPAVLVSAPLTSARGLSDLLWTFGAALEGSARGGRVEAGAWERAAAAWRDGGCKGPRQGGQREKGVRGARETGEEVEEAPAKGLSGGKRAPSRLLSTLRVALSSLASNVVEAFRAPPPPPLFLPTSLPLSTRLVTLAPAIPYACRALQEAQERRLTLVQGSASRAADLEAAGVSHARAALLLADSRAADPRREDLALLFRLWALKVRAPEVPLYAQCSQSSTLEALQVFLDPERDRALALDLVRLRLLALAALCPGAGAFLGNVLRVGGGGAGEGREDGGGPSFFERLLGRRASAPTATERWMQEYVAGCRQSLAHCDVPPELVGAVWEVVVSRVYAQHGVVLLGIGDERVEEGGREATASKDATALRELPFPTSSRETSSPTSPAPRTAPPSFPRVLLNPCASQLRRGDKLVGLAPSHRAFVAAVAATARDMSLQSEWAARGAGAEHQAAVGGVEWVGTQHKQHEQGKRPKGKRKRAAKASADSDTATLDAPLRDHIIVTGDESSFEPFISLLRRCPEGADVPVVVLSVESPSNLALEGQGDASQAPLLRNVIHMIGSSSDPLALAACGAAQARALVFLSTPCEAAPQAGEEGTEEDLVLEDAQALLTCYRAGQASGAEPMHVVAELRHTTSVEFLQPELLLQDSTDRPFAAGRFAGAQALRRAQREVAVRAGLSEWQVNSYYAAGQVTVPALLNSVAIPDFFNRGYVGATLEAMVGADSSRCSPSHASIASPGHSPSSSHPSSVPPAKGLRSILAPTAFIGRAYGQLFEALLVQRALLCVGVARCRPGGGDGARQGTLRYTLVAPSPHAVVLSSDHVLVCS